MEEYLLNTQLIKCISLTKCLNKLIFLYNDAFLINFSKSSDCFHL